MSQGIFELNHGSNASGGEIILSFGFDLWSHNNFLPKNQFMITQSDQFVNKGLKELPVVSCGDCNWGLQYFTSRSLYIILKLMHSVTMFF